jgi:hypothetical protein
VFEQATDPPIVIVAGSRLCVVVVESGSQGVNPPNDVLATYATIPSTLVNCNVFTVCSLSLSHQHCVELLLVRATGRNP